MICKRCGQELPEDAFNSHAGRRGGRNDRCKNCERERRLAYRHTDEGRRQHREANRRVREKRRANAT